MRLWGRFAADPQLGPVGAALIAVRDRPPVIVHERGRYRPVGCGELIRAVDSDDVGCVMTVRDRVWVCTNLAHKMEV